VTGLLHLLHQGGSEQEAREWASKQGSERSSAYVYEGVRPWTTGQLSSRLGKCWSGMLMPTLDRWVVVADTS
jgi:hypothetical protein